MRVGVNPTMIPLYSRIRTTRPNEEYNLPAGATGTVLHAYNNGEAYDIEFDQKVDVTHVATLTSDFVEPLASEMALTAG